MADKHYYRELVPSIPPLPPPSSSHNMQDATAENYCHKVYGHETSNLIRPPLTNHNYSSMDCNQYREPNVTETFTEVWHSLFFPTPPSTGTIFPTTPVAAATTTVTPDPLNNVISTSHTSSANTSVVVNNNNNGLTENADDESHPNGVDIKPYVCTMCNYKCSQKRRMENHLDGVHNNIKNFKCDKCNYRCTERYMLTVHDNAVHKKLRPHKCSECERRFSEKKKMVRHVNEVHRKLKNFKCSTCGFEFYSKEGLRRHVNGVHLKLKPHKCTEPGCKFESGERNHLIRHINVTHKKIKPFECNICDYKCGYKINLEKHINRIHLTDRNVPKKSDKLGHSPSRRSYSLSKKILICSFCDYADNNPTTMYGHIITDHNDLANYGQSSGNGPKSLRTPVKTYKCEECDYRGTKSRLVGHSNAVHKKIKPFKCENSNCSAQFSDKNMLTRHINTVHLKIKPYSCHLCDYKASRKKSLVEHVDRIHKKLRPFKCDQCDYAGTKKHQLTNHINAIHKNYRPFSCDFCDYRAVRKDQLVKHLDNCLYLNKEVVKQGLKLKNDSFCFEKSNDDNAESVVQPISQNEFPSKDENCINVNTEQQEIQNLEVNRIDSLEIQTTVNDDTDHGTSYQHGTHQNNDLSFNNMHIANSQTQFSEDKNAILENDIITVNMTSTNLKLPENCIDIGHSN